MATSVQLVDILCMEMLENKSINIEEFTSIYFSYFVLFFEGGVLFLWSIAIFLSFLFDRMLRSDKNGLNKE